MTANTETPYNWAEDESPRRGGRNPGASEPSFPRPQQDRPAYGPRQGGTTRSSHKEKTFNLNFGKNDAPTAPTQGTPAGSGAGQKAGGKVPGSDFMSNEEIRAFCEHHRKGSRNQATELAMDADHLEAVLRTIPHVSGNLGGSRARARRVTRWLKKAAAAEKAKQKYFASLYGTFEREYDSELRKIGKGTRQPRTTPVRQPFGWK
jgi:hypothetical protein